MAHESANPDRLAALAALGLGPDAKARDIVSAYRRLARLSHPDMADSQHAAEPEFAVISDAYQFLTRGFRHHDVEDSPPEAMPPQPASTQQANPTGGTYQSATAPNLSPMFAAGPVIIRPLPPDST